MKFAQSPFSQPPPSLSPPQGMLNHWDHVDESQLCSFTLACSDFLMLRRAGALFSPSI